MFKRVESLYYCFVKFTFCLTNEQKNKEGVLKGPEEVNVLFQEQDGVWLSIKGKDRLEGKSKKKELKAAVSYIGWKKHKYGKMHILFMRLKLEY